MAILCKVEGQSWRGRLMHLGIFLLLAIGGVTMVYPFMVMIAGSIRSDMDAAELDVVPKFLFDDDVVYQKFLETKYSQDPAAVVKQHRRGYTNFDAVPPPEPVDEKYTAALAEYLKSDTLPAHWTILGGTDFIYTIPANLREMRTRLRDRYNGDLGAYALEAGNSPESWLAITIVPPEWTNRRYNMSDDPVWDVYREMQQEAPAAEIFLLGPTATFLDVMIFPIYGQANTEGYNRFHEVDIARYEDFILPRRVPGDDQPKLRAEWIDFVRELLNPSFITTEGLGADQYHAFLRGEHESIDALNKSWSTSYGSFSEVPMPDGMRWLQGPERRDYLQFILSLPPENLVLTGPEYHWPQWLAQQGVVESAEQAPPIPMALLEYNYATANAGDLRWDYAVRNYVNVWEELVLEGRALWNTVVYCTLSILFALLVNPLAAYALSRFKLPGTYKFLLVLMATMAFPPMVGLLPQYLLLRKLDLMNTYVALLLPMIANGYMIFLLKGFFDSLPQELYEAATIDGAGEVRMFFQITMALSKPILAVIALGTFTAAYAAFLYPLLVAPDPDMWLIAVWLYQFQQRASPGAVFASVILASIPTLLIFIFVQRTIMRGIVVPTEK